jgi:hypothetical protein
MQVRVTKFVAGRQPAEDSASAPEQSIDRPNDDDQQRNCIDYNDRVFSDNSQPFLHQILLRRRAYSTLSVVSSVLRVLAM